MAFLTLEKIKPGSRVFLDSNIFIYHFTGSSAACRDALNRCEQGDLKGLTSVVVLAEVAHRLMMLEALMKGRVRRPGLASKLGSNPALVRDLCLYEEQIEKIPLMGIDILPLDQRLFLRSAELRRRWGLLVNDSIVAATALDAGADALASADRDLQRVKGLGLYAPGDV